LNEDKWSKITENDIHPHLQSRMIQRGITLEELKYTLNKGWDAEDSKSGTIGKTMVYEYHKDWEGQFYEEKEVTVYYKIVDNHIVLLTVKSRYGKSFPKRVIYNEDRI